jgi:thymidine phosphorylase
VPTVLGYGLVELGGGRKRLGEAVDPAVGFVLHVSVGERVAAGQALGTVYASTEAGAQLGLRILAGAVQLGDAAVESPTPRKLVSHRVLEHSVEVL